MTAPFMRDDAIAIGEKEQHLIVPVIRQTLRNADVSEDRVLSE